MANVGCIVIRSHNSEFSSVRKNLAVDDDYGRNVIIFGSPHASVLISVSSEMDLNFSPVSGNRFGKGNEGLPYDCPCNLEAEIIISR
jgi:hypothetical protein